MTENAAIAVCWTAYLASLPAGAETPADYVDASAFGAEGEDELADELAALVERGVKTATSSLLQAYQAGNYPLERAGDRCIVLTSTGQPRCVIEMTEVRIIPFGEVDAAFAADYGEGERTLPWWREHLGAYYARMCAARGWSFGDLTPMICKRFRVVFHCPDACETATSEAGRD